MSEGQAATILVVDDERPIRELAARRLRDEGFDVLAAGGGDEALDLLRAAERIDLLVSDVVIPGWTGFEVAEAVRVRFPRAPVVFVTGWAPERAAEERLREGDALLFKPFSFDELVEQVRALLARTAG